MYDLEFSSGAADSTFFGGNTKTPIDFNHVMASMDGFSRRKVV